MCDCKKNKLVHVRVLLSLLAMAILLSCGSAGNESSVNGDLSVSGDAALSATISIDAAQEVGKYNSLISGSNLNWIYDADGLYDPVTEKINPYVELKIKEMGIKMLRFPGGALSENYDWKSGIGPSSTRGYGLDYDLIMQKMNFGLDDFLTFCENSGIVPVFTVGFSNNTPDTAAEIVEYCNGSVLTPLGALRAQNGHPAPYGVKYWEVGNEIYSQGITIEKATAYGTKTAQMAAAMKQVDPTIRIGAIGLGVSEVWDDSVLKECAQSVDFLVYHRYLPNAIFNDIDQLNNTVIASTSKIMREIQRLQETANNYNQNLAVAVTEYNLAFCDSDGEFINKPPDIQQALFIAECMRLFQLNNVYFATKWDLANIGQHYFSDINFNHGSMPSLAPSFYIQQIYAKAEMETLVKSQFISPTVSVPNFGDNVPVLTAVAGKDISGSVLSVIIINRNLSNSLKVRMDIKNAGTFSQINLTTIKAPLSGPADSFITENTVLAPDALSNITIPAGSISLFKISI